MNRTTLGGFLLSICLAAVPAVAGVNYWSLIGPDGGMVSFLIAAPSNGKILYAGTSGGIFKSTDGGAHWLRASRGLPGAVRQLTMDPTNPRVLYSATLNDGIYTFTRAGR